MRQRLVVLVAVTASLLAACAPVGGSVGIRGPNVSVGIRVSSYPSLVRIPGHPVYYAPRLGWNYFFYDGLYWVLDGDNWHASAWFDGPWDLIDPFFVPVYVLRVPVRYYVRPPAWFRGWPAHAPPRWDEHWGRDWTARRSDWNRRDARPPVPAPLPHYQREYSGSRYPRSLDEQRTLYGERYRFDSRDPDSARYWQRQGGAPTPQAAPPRSTERPAARPPQQPDRPATRPGQSPPRAQPAPPRDRADGPQERGRPRDEDGDRGQDRQRERDDEGNRGRRQP